MGGAEERLKLGEMKKIERTETGVFEVVFETEQEEAGLFELVEGSEDVVGSLKMKKLLQVENLNLKRIYRALCSKNWEKFWLALELLITLELSMIGVKY